MSRKLSHFIALSFVANEIWAARLFETCCGKNQVPYHSLIIRSRGKLAMTYIRKVPTCSQVFSRSGTTDRLMGEMVAVGISAFTSPRKWRGGGRNKSLHALSCLSVVATRHLPHVRVPPPWRSAECRFLSREYHSVTPIVGKVNNVSHPTDFAVSRGQDDILHSTHLSITASIFFPSPSVATFRNGFRHGSTKKADTVFRA